MSSPLLVDILAYWNLNDDGSGGVSLVDSTGNGYTLTNNNGVTLGTGIIGGGAVFNGSDSFSTGLTYDPNGSFSYFCWVYPTQFGGGPNNINDIFYGDSTVGQELRIDENGYLITIIYDGAGFPSAVSASPLTLNQWNFVGCIRDASTNTISVYINGVQSGNIFNYSSNGLWNNGLFTIGNSASNDGVYYGTIDEIGVWSRALSSTEVYDLYYGGLGNTYPFTNPLPVPLTAGCKSYWNLNDNGSGGVSLVDSTGNGYTLTNNNNVTLGTGIIAGDAVFNGSNYLQTSSVFSANTPISFSGWINTTSSGPWGGIANSVGSSGGFRLIGINGDIYFQAPSATTANTTGASYNDGNWHFCVGVADGSNISLYVDGSLITSVADNSTAVGTNFLIGNGGDFVTNPAQIDEVGVWSRVLSDQEITYLYNNGSGLTYPFNKLYYNNAQEDGDWGNLLNWWQDAGFTIQATALPDSTHIVNLYGPVTQNTQGANQCFCHDANFWSADFGAGLTLQSTGVVNMQGSSVMAGATTDGVSMHDSSQLALTSVVDGNVTMRDSSRAFGSILGNATIYYDGGNGQFPIGGTVAGSVTYLGWPAVSPQWFNDTVSLGGAGNGDFSNTSNWWTDNTFTTRPINAEGTQELPDASTDVFIAPTIGITTNSGTANPTINSVTANNSNIQNISITATNGFLFSGNQGVENAVLYGNVVFQDTAYNDHAVIQGKATYKSAASLQNSWYQNSLGNVNAGMYNGSTSFEVNIPTGNSNKGFLSTLLGFPWYIRF